MLSDRAVRGAKPGLLFKFADECCLTRERLVFFMRHVLAATNIFGDHRFRIGAATTADRELVQQQLQLEWVWRTL